MTFFNGLIFAVALFFFEGIIIQCNARESRQPNLPDELIGEILAMTGLQETREVARANMKVAGDAIRRLFEIRKIVFRQRDAGDEQSVFEVQEGGETFLQISNYTKLMSLFDQFHSHAKRIHINYIFLTKQQCLEIGERIIRRCANQLTELQIAAQLDTGIWEDGKPDVQFPNVESFIWLGLMQRKNFDLNAMFPRLKSFTLLGSVTDTNCLANVRNLKELNLLVRSIQEHQLENIFRNNQRISKLALITDIGNVIKKETLRSVENLKNLEKLKIYKVSPDFFNRASHRVYNLTSVTSFEARFDEIIESNGNFSFDMPNVKHLHLQGLHIDGRISDVINHFTTLKTVILFVIEHYDVIDCIKQLKHVKEITTNNIYSSQFPSLGQFFESFDITRSKLEKLMFLFTTDDEYTSYQNAMVEINNKSRRFNKPTWRLSRITLDSGNYMLFKRV